METLSDEALDLYLSQNSIDIIRDERLSERYDLISFGGGSCPRVVGRHAHGFGWKKLCFLTNGSDNGGSTYDIVEALRPIYGPTLPVGDITSAFIGLLDTCYYEILNLRGWKLDPQRFSEAERKRYREASANFGTFRDRLSLAVEFYQNKCSDSSIKCNEDNTFYSQLIQLGELVDKTGLVKSGVKGLDISHVSVRHHIFNALMIRVGAYDSECKKPNNDRFMVGLWLLQNALNIPYAVYPCSLDEQILYAEWNDESGQAIWSTKHTLLAAPVLSRGGQVALSNAPDRVKILSNRGYARYGRFGFDPAGNWPTTYPEAVYALTQLRPGSPIIYGPSSFIASISPCLALPEIVRNISERQDCPKILFLNLTLNNETVGMSVTDFLNFWELNTGRPIATTVNYVVVNNDTNSSTEIADALSDKGDSLETFKFRGPLVLTEEERQILPRRQLVLVEAPLATVNRQLMRLSSSGEREHVFVPNHHSERLMAIAYAIVEHFAENDQGIETAKPSDGGSLLTKNIMLDSGEKFETIFYCSGEDNT